MTRLRAPLRATPTIRLTAAHSEAYESFGETTGGVHDLEPVVDEMREARREYISSGDADLELSGEHPASAAVMWQYFVDPDKRLRWQPNQKAIKNQANPHGRLGTGASSHCAHGVGGDVLREYLDWRPFRYFTNRMTPLSGGLMIPPRAIETTEFIPLADGTTLVHYRIRLEDRSRLGRLRFRIVRRFFRMVARRSIERLHRILEADDAAPGLGEKGDPQARS